MGPVLFPYTPWKDTWRIRIIRNWDVIFFAQVVFFLPPHDIKLMNKRCPHCLRRSSPAQRRCGSYCSGCCQRERMPLPPSICSAGVILCRHVPWSQDQLTKIRWPPSDSLLKTRQINYMISAVFFFICITCWFYLWNTTEYSSLYATKARRSHSYQQFHNSASPQSWLCQQLTILQTRYFDHCEVDNNQSTFYPLLLGNFVSLID